MLTNAYHRLRARLASLYGLSIYGALLLVVFGGLVIPAIIGSYVLIGVQEQKSAKTALNESLQRNADILALGCRGAAAIDQRQEWPWPDPRPRLPLSPGLGALKG